MAPETPERLTRWMLPVEGSHLPLDHPVQEDLAWAADEIVRLREALESIRQHGSDTLSGRMGGPDDRRWQRAAVAEMTRRAGDAIEAE